MNGQFFWAPTSRPWNPPVQPCYCLDLGTHCNGTGYTWPITWNKLEREGGCDVICFPPFEHLLFFTALLLFSYHLFRGQLERGKVGSGWGLISANSSPYRGPLLDTGLCAGHSEALEVCQKVPGDCQSWGAKKCQTWSQETSTLRSPTHPSPAIFSSSAPESGLWPSLDLKWWGERVGWRGRERSWTFIQPTLLVRHMCCVSFVSC